MYCSVIRLKILLVRELHTWFREFGRNFQESYCLNWWDMQWAAECSVLHQRTTAGRTLQANECSEPRRDTLLEQRDPENRLQINWEMCIAGYYTVYNKLCIAYNNCIINCIIAYKLCIINVAINKLCIAGYYTVPYRVYCKFTVLYCTTCTSCSHVIQLRIFVGLWKNGLCNFAVCFYWM